MKGGERTFNILMRFKGLYMLVWILFAVLIVAILLTVLSIGAYPILYFLGQPTDWVGVVVVALVMILFVCLMTLMVILTWIYPDAMLSGEGCIATWWKDDS